MKQDPQIERVTTDWIVAVGDSVVRIGSPSGRQWSVDLPSEDAAALVQYMERGGATQKIEELLLALRNVGAFGVRDDAGGGSAHVPVLFDPAIAQFKEAIDVGSRVSLVDIDNWPARPVVVLVSDLAAPFVATVNEKLIADKKSAFLLMVRGQTIFAGPLLDPWKGTACLRCLQERWNSSFLEVLGWPQVEALQRLFLGQPEISIAAVRLGLELASDILTPLSAGLPEARLATEVRRLSLDSWQMDNVGAYPLPWCDACSELLPEERPLVGIKSGED